MMQFIPITYLKLLPNHNSRLNLIPISLFFKRKENIHSKSHPRNGLGRSVALRFAQAYPFVILLSRSQSSYQPIVDEINSKSITPSADSGSKATTTRAIGFSSDASDPEAVASVFDKVRAGADGFLPQDAKLPSPCSM
jgi:hypothetical protein